MVPKKDGTARPCWDYQRLNERTSGDAYTIPHIHNFTSSLAGCKVFSKVYLVKGYHQIPVHEADVPKTAIATPFGLFEFVRMPFGLKNSAQTFQRLMDSVTSKLSGVFCVSGWRVDCITIASERHERNLRQLFAALSQHGLVLNVNKCVFGVKQLQFLGHVVSEPGGSPAGQGQGSKAVRAATLSEIYAAVPWHGKFLSAFSAKTLLQSYVHSPMRSRARHVSWSGTRKWRRPFGKPKRVWRKQRSFFTR